MRAKPVLSALILVAAVALCALPAAALNGETSSPSKARTIEVAGNAEAHASPDLATLNLAIETHAATAEQCASENGALARKVGDAIEAKLGDKGRTWTGGYSLYPEYNEPRGNQKPTIVGYRAENSITVETGALDHVGPLIDAAIAAGANRINSLQFSLRDDTKARSDAIAMAAKDAQAQAQSLATALGVKLGPVVKASTEEVRPIPVMARASFAAMPMSSTP
ncbi:MAG: SIMPL domain-containing protein, partial [Pseudomonadota bacterium]